jgi:membrane-bound serine protease (ClpP class)
MKRAILYLIVLVSVLGLSAQPAGEPGTGNPMKVYTFDIAENIAPPAWRTMQQAFEEAEKMNADLILIRMNTYGGMLATADSMRTRILNSRIPVWVFIDNNAASAGALISIACERIYMRPG